ncbi:unnamed protein product [Amoebophrya sp. A25]|nr:unnamed protein product [Amoebophrya sp. A25]|eukprot:GSA25T00024686001.1
MSQNPSKNNELDQDEISTVADSRVGGARAQSNLGMYVAESIRDGANQFANGVEAGYGSLAGDQRRGGTSHSEAEQSDGSRTGGFTSDFYNPHPRADMSDSSSDNIENGKYQPQQNSSFRDCGRVFVFICLILVMLAPCICMGTGIFCLVCRNENSKNIGYRCDKGRPTMTVFGYVLISLGVVLISAYCFVCCCRRTQDQYLIEQDEDEYEQDQVPAVK